MAGIYRYTTLADYDGANSSQLPYADDIEGRITANSVLSIGSYQDITGVPLPDIMISIGTYVAWPEINNDTMDIDDYGLYLDYSTGAYNDTVSVRFWGSALGDILIGGGSDDRLDGQGGIDRLSGGLGNDVYTVDNIGDVVTELAGEGTDTLQSSISWVLGDNLENLTLTGSGRLNGLGNDLDNVLTGNDGANYLNGEDGDDTLIGGSGNDKLNGGVGIDLLDGGQGNDTYYVDDRSDVLVEGAGAGSGRDTVFVGVSGYALADGVHVERIVLLDGVRSAHGNDLANTMIGSADANSLVGGDGADRLEGRDGADLLIGGAGADTLIGGAGADTFRFDGYDGSVDTIARFETGTDRIALSTAYFGSEAPAFGALDAAQFQANDRGAAIDADDRVIFNTRTGALYFDADGSGAGAAVQIGKVTGASDLSASDVELVDVSDKLADFTDSTISYAHLFPNVDTVNSQRTIAVGDGAHFAYRAGSGVSAFIDIVGDQIILSTTASSIGFSQPSGGFHGFRIEDVTDMIADIASVSVNAASAAFDASRIAFTDDSVTVNIGGFILGQNETVILDVEFAW